MANNLPNFFVDEVRLEIYNSTGYTDDEIGEYARISIQKTTPSLQLNVTVESNHATNLWDFTVSGVDNSHVWEVYKWATVSAMTKDYYRDIISQGVGVSIGLGAERIDTKSVLITVKDDVKRADKKIREQILAYNLIHRKGSVVDLYYDDPSS